MALVVGTGLILGSMRTCRCVAIAGVAALLGGLQAVAIHLGAIWIINLWIGGDAHMGVLLRARVRAAAGGMRRRTCAGSGRVRLGAWALLAAAIIAASWGLTTAWVASTLIAAATVAGIASWLLRATAATALSAAAHDGFGFNIRVWFEAGDHYFGNFTLEYALDVAQVIAFIHAH